MLDDKLDPVTRASLALQDGFSELAYQNKLKEIVAGKAGIADWEKYIAQKFPAILGDAATAIPVVPPPAFALEERKPYLQARATLAALQAHVAELEREAAKLSPEGRAATAAAEAAARAGQYRGVALARFRELIRAGQVTAQAIDEQWRADKLACEARYGAPFAAQVYGAGPLRLKRGFSDVAVDIDEAVMFPAGGAA